MAKDAIERRATRAPKLCRVPDLKGAPCGNVAVGRCMVEVDWTVCTQHWQLVANNGFCPMTFERIEADREAQR